MKQLSIWIGLLLGAAFMVWFLHCFAFSSYLVLSSDMNDTLLPGERIIVNKWSYGLRTPYMSWFGYHRWNAKPIEKGDVVVFNQPAGSTQKTIDRRPIFVYRCMAIPGDTLSVDSYHFIIPQKGSPVTITDMNRTLLCNTINLHEGHQATITHDTLYVDHRPVKSYVFTKDYYWMIADHATNISDSHLFGLVPSDHIIGRAVFIWFSKDNSRDVIHGYRWNRFFHAIR